MSERYGSENFATDEDMSDVHGKFSYANKYSYPRGPMNPLLQCQSQ
jgi:hypothetical protein